MQSVRKRVLLSLGLALLAAMPLAAQVVPAPETVLGFVPGTDRKVVEWPGLVEYYQQLADASDRLQYRVLGKTTLGKPRWPCRDVRFSPSIPCPKHRHVSTVHQRAQSP